jgi:XTP/dITP diphosphohydrolase
VPERDSRGAVPQHTAALRLLIASSNPGKLREYRALAEGCPPGVALDLDLLPQFAQLPPFDESAPTFAENAAGKALHYSRFADELVVADDSGLVVDALGGAPGVHSARYAGPGGSDAACVTKLLRALAAARGEDRRARFVCDLALARHGRVAAVFSDAVEGEITRGPRGAGGFGYDPVFFFPPLGRTFAEVSGAQKNLYSHRGKAFRKLLEFLASTPVL